MGKQVAYYRDGTCPQLVVRRTFGDGEGLVEPRAADASESDPLPFLSPPQVLSCRRVQVLDAAISVGMISSFVPIARISPSARTTILSAVSRMRS